VTWGFKVEACLPDISYNCVKGIHGNISVYGYRNVHHSAYIYIPVQLLMCMSLAAFTLNCLDREGCGLGWIGVQSMHAEGV